MKNSLIFLFVLSTLFPKSVFSGELKGKVIVSNTPPASSKIVSRSIIKRYVNKDKTQAHIHSDGERPPIVIYIDDIEYTHGNDTTETAVLDQKDQTFIPHVLPVLAGTTVRFPNSDVVYHNVFSFSKTKSFDLGRYATGKSKTVKFDNPGIVKVYCDIHSHMNAFIVVLKNPYFAISDKNGNFEIKNIPAGKYTLKAWYGHWPEKSQPIKIAANGTTEIEFTFP
jgi:plastocyanin